MINDKEITDKNTERINDSYNKITDKNTEKTKILI